MFLTSVSEASLPVPTLRSTFQTHPILKKNYLSPGWRGGKIKPIYLFWRIFCVFCTQKQRNLVFMRPAAACRASASSTQSCSLRAVITTSQPLSGLTWRFNLCQLNLSGQPDSNYSRGKIQGSTQTRFVF